MLAHKWAESYRSDNTAFSVARNLLQESQFFCMPSCLDQWIDLFDGHVFTADVQPPFPNTAVVIRMHIEKTDTFRTVIGFFIQRSAHDFDVYVTSQQDAERWVTSPCFMWQQIGEGFQLIQSHERPNPFKDYAEPDDEFVSEFVFAICQAAWMLFTVISSSSVTTTDHPAPKALNKKREKKGKLPLVSYKTLQLNVPNIRNEKENHGGTHSSPRLHFRRGHVRKLRSGRIVKVQPCIVGSKHGMVVKDYHVKAPTASVLP